MAVLEHICEVRGVAADFAGTILAVGAQCVQHTTEARVMQESPRRNTNVIMVWAWMLW